jgi:putative transcriptional regulator
MPPEVDIKALRQCLRMTQTVFAEKFALNLQTLRDWEQARYQPTGPERMLLMVIDNAPER